VFPCRYHRRARLGCGDDGRITGLLGRHEPVMHSGPKRGRTGHGSLSGGRFNGGIGGG